MHAVAKPLSALTLALALGGLAACTAEVVPGDPQNPGNPATGGTTGAGGSATAGGGTTDPTPDCTTPAVPRAPLRRLTRFEYNNTVRDLVKDTTSPATAFPSEDSGNGFGNDADRQPLGDALANQHILVAESVAAGVTTGDRIAELGACAAEITAATDAAIELSCVRSIAETFGAKAFRRPLLAADVDGFVQLFQQIRVDSDFRTSLATMVEAFLQSPEFLYKPEFGVPVAGRTDVLRPSGDEMATRLSYLLWGSMPDDVLRGAAASGELMSDEGVMAQAKRMLQDSRAKTQLRFFFDNLLPISDLANLERGEFENFTPKLGSLMREETQKFLEHQIFEGPGTWPSVFTANYTFVNQELAAFYGFPGVTGEAFQRVELAGTKRTGLLTQAGVVAGPVHTNEANPVVRGSFIVQKLLCLPIPLPTGEVAAKVTPPDPNSAATARQRFTQHSLDTECRGCHINMDPVGYALENMDVIGQWREQENGVTIDASGEAPLIGKFNGPIELGQRIAESEAAQQCFASHWLNFGYGRSVKEDEACVTVSVRNKFKETGYNVQELLLALTQSDAFRHLPAVRE